MTFASCKLVVTVIDTIVIIAVDNQTVISFPAVAVDHGVFDDFTLNYG
jgi:hypothetical protein